MMQMRMIVPLFMILLFIFPRLVLAQGAMQDMEKLIGKDKITSLHLLGARASRVAMEQLSFTKGDDNVLAMTNAGHAIINGQTTEKCIDGVIAASGCTIGGGNLLLIHRSKEKPLWFAFFRKDTRECVYLQVNNAVVGKSLTELNALADESIFTIAKENIAADNLLGDPEKWDEKMKGKVFGGNEFSIVTIANVWAHPKCTYDLLQAAQLHNHICPGLTSGHLIIKYLDKNLPLKPGQEYKIIACPPWCKDDAFQVILDTTVGKRGIYVKELTDEQKEGLPEQAKGVAGLYVRWDKKANMGEGLVLAFDWDEASKLCGVNRKDFRDFATHRWWSSRLKMALGLMEYLDKPETLVTTLKQFNLGNKDELTHLQAAGINPLVEVGLMPAEQVKVKSVAAVPVWAYTVMAILAVIVIGLLIYAGRVKKK